MIFKRIMLIGESRSLIILSTLQDMLKKEHYDVDFATPIVSEIVNISETPNMILLYAGDYLKRVPEVLKFLKDYCANNGIRIGIIGYAGEIEIIRDKIGEQAIWRTFDRPLNVKELITLLDAEIDGEAEILNKKRILVVDDSEIQLTLIKSWLDGYYEVDTVNSAMAAITYMLTTKPDMILLDYSMPVIDGPKFLEMLNAEETSTHVPVFFLTAMREKDKVKAALTLQPDGYLLKSMSPDKIRETIDKFFAKQTKKKQGKK